MRRARPPAVACGAQCRRETQRTVHTPDSGRLRERTAASATDSSRPQGAPKQHPRFSLTVMGFATAGGFSPFEASAAFEVVESRGGADSGTDGEEAPFSAKASPATSLPVSSAAFAGAGGDSSFSEESARMTSSAARDRAALSESAQQQNILSVGSNFASLYANGLKYSSKNRWKKSKQRSQLGTLRGAVFSSQKSMAASPHVISSNTPLCKPFLF